jgi:xanthine dehydrogenase accessory factor
MIAVQHPHGTSRHVKTRLRTYVQRAPQRMTLNSAPPTALHHHAIIPPAHDVIAAAQRYLVEAGTCALATVIQTWGSAPVPVGGQMAIAGNGRFAGSVSGGCIEADVIMAAQDTIRTAKHRVLTIGVTHDTARQVGLPCGGNISVLLEPLTSPSGLILLDKIATASAQRRGLVVATNLTSGARDILACPITSATLPSDLATRLNGGDSRLDTHKGSSVFYKSHAPPVRLIIVGASHIAQILSTLAHQVGYASIVVDPRAGYAVAERFPGLACVDQWPKDALPNLGLDAFTAVIALAHVSDIDDEALMVALRSNCRYIGVLGSRANLAKRADRLTRVGFSDADIARVKAPIGLDIGALTPAEIAVAILAEIIATLRGKTQK